MPYFWKEIDGDTEEFAFRYSFEFRVASLECCVVLSRSRLIVLVSEHTKRRGTMQRKAGTNVPFSPSHW